MTDAYIIGFKLLCLDLESESSNDLKALRYACSSVFDSIEEELERRGDSDD